jgi:hypothetical protein
MSFVFVRKQKPAQKEIFVLIGAVAAYDGWVGM